MLVRGEEGFGSGTWWTNSALPGHNDLDVRAMSTVSAVDDRRGFYRRNPMQTEDTRGSGVPQ